MSSKPVNPCEELPPQGQVNELQGQVADRLIETGVDMAIDNADAWSRDLVALAKARESDLLA
jgi:hypothetical protein